MSDKIDKQERINKIYVYSTDVFGDGWFKVGQTTRSTELRVKEQFKIFHKDIYKIEHEEEAVRHNGEMFEDHDVHRILKKKGVTKNGEFFQTDLETIKSAILTVKLGLENAEDIENRTETFEMRAEQHEAVNKTSEYFSNSFLKYPNERPQFLWNAKMRFGKTFASYQLALKLGFKKVLVITYKPAVESAWREDLLTHLDFLGWQFISRNEGNLESSDLSQPFVYFASFQDLLGTTVDGETKKHNEWIHNEDWDMVIQDEYHYGAWRDTAKELLDSEDKSEETQEGSENMKNLIKAKCFLYLSGTPFRAIETGEFTEAQIYNWTYADEQKVKREYKGNDNPYASLPEMKIYTYQLPDELKKVAVRGEYDEFSLSYFFKAEGEYETARFKNEEQVQSWLNIIRGKFDEEDIEKDLKMKDGKASFPFTDRDLQKNINHMLWFMPDVASCYAMERLLKEPHNKYYNKDYEILVVAGKRTGSGIKALEPVNEAMRDPLKSKTITLTCGKLTTGVTVKPWTAIFMLRTLRSPESYFQSAFRVQSPWVIKENRESKIQKETCYVFDFDPNRALQQIAEYANKLSPKNDVSIEEKISEFIKYLPILAYDGFAMEKIDAEGLLDISLGQTTSTLLAKGWNNNLLLNTDNETLIKMINSEDAMRIINSIESYRKKGNVDKTIVSSSKIVNDLKTKKKAEGKLQPEEKKVLTKEEKEFRGKKELLQEKLKTLATRIPLFMYLTDYREEKLTDVITKLQPELFYKITGVSVEDFEILVNIGLFNSDLMNKVVYKFRRYEDASMGYSGINRHEGETIAGFDVVEKPTAVKNKYRYSVPKPLKYKNAKVIFKDNKLIIEQGSVIFTDINNSIVLQEDLEVSSLSEAASKISAGFHNDWSFFGEM